MTRPFLLKAAVLLLLLAIGAAIGVSCIPERRVPPPGPPAPTAVKPDILMRDLAGHERNPRRGITPGALEAEAGPPRETETN